MLCLSFHKDTFYYIEDHIFLFLNAKLNLFINMYEEEIIDTDQLDEALSILENIVDNTDDKAVIDFGQMLIEIVALAKKHKTIVGFYF